jgi:hypothetical protein
MKKAKDYFIELSLVIIGILIAFAIENWAHKNKSAKLFELM